MSYRKTVDANSIAFTQEGTGAVASTVQTKFGETLSVTDFGAVGDAVTDDSAAIQSALDAMGFGDTLLFPNGIYLLLTGLNITKSGVTLKGSNTIGDGGDPQWDYGKGPVLITNVAALDHLTLTWTYSTPYTYFSTSLLYQGTANTLYTSNVTIDGLQFSSIGAEHTGIAVNAKQGNKASDMTVRNCTFQGIGSPIACPMSNGGYGSGLSLIEGNSFYKKTTIPTTASDAILLGTGGVIIRNNEITWGAIRYHAGVTQTHRVLITGNNPCGHIDASADTGSGGDWVISSNSFVDMELGSMNIILDGIRRFSIVDNTIGSGTQGAGIEIRSLATDGIIANNLLMNTAQSTDVISCAGQRVTITDNHIQSLQATNFVVLEALSQSCRVSGNAFLDTTGKHILPSIACPDLSDPTSGGGLNIVANEGGERVNITVFGEFGETGATGEIGENDGPLIDIADAGGTITLPSVAVAARGKVLHFKDSAGNAFLENITVEGSTGETIDGASSFILDKDFQSVTIANMGDTWSKLSDTGEVNPLGVTTLGATGELTTEDFVACTTGGITVTLPVAATVGSGKVVYIKDRDGNANASNITIEGNGSETIDDSLNLVMNVDYQAVTLVTDGLNWMTV
jgi:hypothetical protein